VDAEELRALVRDAVAAATAAGDNGYSAA
jgi:hypothetical protein